MNGVLVVFWDCGLSIGVVSWNRQVLQTSQPSSESDEALTWHGRPKIHWPQLTAQTKREQPRSFLILSLALLTNVCIYCFFTFCAAKWPTKLLLLRESKHWNESGVQLSLFRTLNCTQKIIATVTFIATVIHQYLQGALHHQIPIPRWQETPKRSEGATRAASRSEKDSPEQERSRLLGPGWAKRLHRVTHRWDFCF